MKHSTHGYELAEEQEATITKTAKGWKSRILQGEIRDAAAATPKLLLKLCRCRPEVRNATSAIFVYQRAKGFQL
jgi:hypothetical protein